jgi:hypothetical protein
MEAVFIHNNFTGQYRHLMAALVDRGDRVVAVGGLTVFPLQGKRHDLWVGQPGGAMLPMLILFVLLQR